MLLFQQQPPLQVHSPLGFTIHWWRDLLALALRRRQLKELIAQRTFTEEVPLTLHCGHTVGSICLNEWLNGGQPPKQTCPFCRTKVYQTVFRRLDQDIEDAALRGIVDGVRIADTSTQGLLRDQILEDRRIEGLIYFKLTKMPSQFLDTDNYKISKPQAMDCILNAIGLYLMHASSKEDKSRPSRYGSLMTELLKYRQRNCPIELRAYRIELEKAIQTAIFLAYWLKIPYSNKSILLKQIIEKDGQVGFDPHPEDGDDMIRVARAAPRLLLALYWGTSPSASRFWRLDVQQLLKADVQLRGHYDGSNVYERMEDIPAHVSFRKPLVKKVLESWGITDVEAKASFNDCKYSRGRWVIDPSGGW
ncbi:uncharacterized protein KY384_005069 [Bacidia gigantensis]|uniref:uncharacterized protein n=1 Tax=Bacidia gigantensis TaxID=2732470 RepID=UPI001D049D63|nr:uncharacterized protein KY384_005069 [Bacidia gigantensis]KAG8530566.1 hypothetical protein KY384_005069 [Bacidia gigantensis]